MQPFNIFLIVLSGQITLEETPGPAIATLIIVIIIIYSIIRAYRPIGRAPALIF